MGQEAKRLIPELILWSVSEGHSEKAVKIEAEIGQELGICEHDVKPSGRSLNESFKVSIKAEETKSISSKLEKLIKAKATEDYQN